MAIDANRVVFPLSHLAFLAFVRMYVQVILSGTILAVSLSCLSVLQMDMVSSIGIGGAVSVFCTMICSLTLIPATLFIFGKWAQQNIRAPTCYQRVRARLWEPLPDVRLNADSSPPMHQMSLHNHGSSR